MVNGGDWQQQLNNAILNQTLEILTHFSKHFDRH